MFNDFFVLNYNPRTYLSIKHSLLSFHNFLQNIISNIDVWQNHYLWLELHEVLRSYHRIFNEIWRNLVFEFNCYSPNIPWNFRYSMERKIHIWISFFNLHYLITPLIITIKILPKNISSYSVVVIRITLINKIHANIYARLRLYDFVLSMFVCVHVFACLCACVCVNVCGCVIFRVLLFSCISAIFFFIHNISW